MKNIFRITSFIIIFLLVFGNISSVLVHSREHDWGVDTRRKQVLDSGANFDALFIGGSKVQVGIQPTAIFEETDILSFNLATNTQPPIVTKHLVSFFVKKNKPRIVVLDLPGLLYEPDPNNAVVRNNYMTGIQLIGDKTIKKNIISDIKDCYDVDDYKSYQSEFYKDHSRWKLLTKKDFVHDSNDYRFFLGGINTISMRDENIALSSRKKIFNYEQEESILKGISYHNYSEIIKFLKEESIPVIIIIPPVINVKTPLFSSIHAFAEEHDLPILDYNLESKFSTLEFNEKGDFYDGSHLSIVGADKFSRVLASDLQKIIDEPREQDLEIMETLESYVDQYNKYVESRREHFTFDE